MKVNKKQKNKIASTNNLIGVIICDCGSVEHQIIIQKEEGNEISEKEVYLQVHLKTYRSFFKRLYVGFRYAFGYKSRFGDWDCIIVSKQNYKPLKDAVRFIENKTKNKHK